MDPNALEIIQNVLQVQDKLNHSSQFHERVSTVLHELKIEHVNELDLVDIIIPRANHRNIAFELQGPYHYSPDGFVTVSTLFKERLMLMQGYDVRRLSSFETTGRKQADFVDIIKSKLRDVLYEGANEQALDVSPEEVERRNRVRESKDREMLMLGAKRARGVHLSQADIEAYNSDQIKALKVLSPDYYKQCVEVGWIKEV